MSRQKLRELVVQRRESSSGTSKHAWIYTPKGRVQPLTESGQLNPGSFEVSQSRLRCLQPFLRAFTQIGRPLADRANRAPDLIFVKVKHGDKVALSKNFVWRQTIFPCKGADLYAPAKHAKVGRVGCRPSPAAI